MSLWNGGVALDPTPPRQKVRASSVGALKLDVKMLQQAAAIFSRAALGFTLDGEVNGALLP